VSKGSEPAKAEERAEDLGADSLIYERVLASMRDGVVTIDLTGRIVTFNEAAAATLDLRASDVLGQSFAEVFLMEECYEDFNEVVLKAIYEAETTHSEEVSIACPNGERLDLAVSSSFLTVEEDGKEKRYGVVVVFSDVTEQRKRRKLKRLFGEYLDPRVVERILSRDAIPGVGQRESMTVFFTDMRDFTGWSERLPAERLIEVLNRFLASMTAPIGAEGGITDKFIGDAIMAYWGPPFTDPAQQAVAACKAALGQRAALKTLRQDLADLGVAEAERLDAATGIATGEVVVGDVGTDQNRNFTVIGDRVNVAARLQTACKLYGQPVLICEETRRQIGEGFFCRELDFAVLKGRAQAERVFALLAYSDAVDPAERSLSETYESGLALFRAREFVAASERFQACLGLNPDDRAARLMIARCEALGMSPPEEDWDGVFPESFSLPASGSRI